MVTVPFQEQDEKKETPNRDGHTRVKELQPDLVKELHVYDYMYMHPSPIPWRPPENWNSPVCGWSGEDQSWLLHDGEWPGG